MRFVVGLLNVIPTVLSQVFAAAVQRNKRLDATTAHVYHEVKVWLRQACDRRGGRQTAVRGTKRQQLTGDQKVAWIFLVFSRLYPQFCRLQKR